MPYKKDPSPREIISRLTELVAIPSISSIESQSLKREGNILFWVNEVGIMGAVVPGLSTKIFAYEVRETLNCFDGKDSRLNLMFLHIVPSTFYKHH